MFSALADSDIPGRDRRKLLLLERPFLSLVRDKEFEPCANCTASYRARPSVFRTVTKNGEVRSFGEKCRLQSQIVVSSAISSTVSHPEGLSLLGILGLRPSSTADCPGLLAEGEELGSEPSPA